MADTLTDVLELTIQTVGGNENTWGDKNNDNFQRVDDKIGKLATINTTGGTTVLSDAQEFVAAIRVTGSLISNATLEFSGRKGFWIIFNDTTGAFSVICDAGAETVEVAQGTASIIYADGTDTLEVAAVGDFLSDEAWPAELTVASAATADVLGAASLFVLVSGTTTITSLGTGTWRYRVVRFSGALTLTHHATSLILPGGANITTAAGDVAIFVSDGSSNARCISYQRASGLPLNANLATIGGYASIINLTGFAGLTSAADRVPYFTADTGAMALATFAAAARNFLANPTEACTIVVTRDDQAVTTGTAKRTFRLPYAVTLVEVRAQLVTPQTSGSTFTVDINESGTTVLSTKLTIDNTEETSETAVAPPVISDANLADDAEITIDVDQIGDGTAKGLKVTLIWTRAAA